ncbi:protein phosphatase 2C [Pelomyxa schiedti]|nr:protein phosphatase 2C [Pelomyxa schiedti]
MESDGRGRPAAGEEAAAAEIQSLRERLAHSEAHVEQLRAEAEAARERAAGLARDRDAATAELKKAQAGGCPACEAAARERDGAAGERDRATRELRDREATLRGALEDLRAAREQLEQSRAENRLLTNQIQMQLQQIQMAQQLQQLQSTATTTTAGGGLILPVSDPSQSQDKVKLDVESLNLADLAAGLDVTLPSVSSTETSLVQFTIPSAEDPNCPLLKTIHCCENMNLAGLKKQKKKPTFPSGKLEMEDMHYFEFPWQGNSDLAFLGVFDGFAGTGASLAAKAKFAPHLHTMITSDSPKPDYSDILTKCFSEVDQQLSDMEYEGCTCSVVIIWRYEGRRYLQAANVGDSSAFLCQGGVSVELTFDHKVTAPEENERLVKTAKDFEPHQTRISGCVAVARALGTHFMKREGLGIISEPHISPPMCLNSEHQFVIVASDGLWDVMSGQDVCDVLRGVTDAREMASTVISTALRHPKCTDNITVLVGAL